jgi:hypothetical protein
VDKHMYRIRSTVHKVDLGILVFGLGSRWFRVGKKQCVDHGRSAACLRPGRLYLLFKV